MIPEPTADPVCGRHPDRVTYVSCTRCGSPICTDCMTPAAVGFHCPQCVEEGRLRVRIRPAFTPRITQALLVACIGLHLLGFLGIGTSTAFLAEFSMYPYAVAFGETYRLITAVFIHSGWLHLGMNMIMLWALGRGLEQAFGRTRFLALFLLSGLGGTVASYWFNDPRSIGVGASGAIFGCFAAMFMLGREYRVNTQEIVAVVGINLLIGFIVPNVDWHAHLGGLAAGAVLGWALLPTRPRLLTLATPVLLVGVLGAAISLRSDLLLAGLLG